MTENQNEVIMALRFAEAVPWHYTSDGEPAAVAARTMREAVEEGIGMSEVPEYPKMASFAVVMGFQALARIRNGQVKSAMTLLIRANDALADAMASHLYDMQLQVRQSTWGLNNLIEAFGDGASEGSQ